MRLHPHQATLDQAIIDAWAAGHQNVLAVLGCGGGKTPVAANRLWQHQGASVAIAHRQELVGQLSKTIARYGLKHRILAPDNVVRQIVQEHIAEFGRDFYDPSAPCAVAGVGTLNSWAKPTSKNYHAFKHWSNQVTLWFFDEAAHICASSWLNAVALFPNAKGLGVTATAERADGKGLGRHADGVFDIIVLGPEMREMINGLPDHNGIIRPYLADYRVFCPPSDLDVSTVTVGADGDYNREKLGKATRKSNIMGHVVEHYQLIAPGKLAILFAPDMETAQLFYQQFNVNGIPAEIVSAVTPQQIRFDIMRKFRQRRVLVLINIDIMGEGVDVPDVEVVIMARATQSYTLYHQQFNRATRLSGDPNKVAIIIDHVNNVRTHRLPDRVREWSLDRRERKASKLPDPNAIPLKICCNPVCMAPYDAYLDECPYCHTAPVPAGRATVEQVDGCLYELSAEALAVLRGEVDRVDQHPDAVRSWMRAAGHDSMVANSAAARQREKQEAQGLLRSALAGYGGIQQYLGLSDREAQRKFYLQFGIDVLSAMALGRADAVALTERLVGVIGG